MLSQADSETRIDEFDAQLKEKVNKEELDPKDELKLKRETLLKIQNILKIPKGAKSIEDLRFLYNYCMNFKFFSTGIELYGKNTILNLLDCCNYFEVAANDIVINLGDNVKSAFILISGSIKISSLKKDVDETEQDKVRFKTSDKINKVLNLFLYKTLKNVTGDFQHSIRQTMEMLLANSIRFSKPKNKKVVNIEDDWCVGIGEMFGDKYLIERKTSSLSFLATQKSVLLEIKKKDFYNLLEATRKEEYLKELKFFHSISVFSDFSRNAIERMKLNLKEKRYFNGELVIEQNQLINHVYIVKSGSFQVTFKSTKNIVNEFDLNYYTSITPLDFRFTENRKHEIKGFKKTEENLKLLTVEKGQFIGDLEFIQNREKSFFRVTCIHEGSVLISIPRIIFNKHVTDQKDDFYDFTKERENYYKERFKKLSAISKALCFDNPENKYLNDLIVRINDGMHFIKKQEKKQSKTNKDNNALKDNNNNSNSFDSEIKKDIKREKINEAVEANNNKIKKKFYKQNTPKRELANDEYDFLKHYNRTGDYNDKFKRIKRKIIKRSSIDSINDSKIQDKNTRNKSAIPQKEEQKELNDEINELLKDEKKQSDRNLFLKSSQKLNILNSGSINANRINQLSEAKNGSLVKSIAPKKVVELFSKLRKVSSFFKDKYNNNINNKKETQSFSNNFFSSLVKESSKLLSNKELNFKDVNRNNSAYIFKSALNNDILEKNKNTLNHSSTSVNNANESQSKTNLKASNLNKEKNNFYKKGTTKKNKSLITHKIKIKKIALDDWKKESNNMLNNSIELSINNSGRKKETFKKIEFFTPYNNFEKLVEISKRPSTAFYYSNKMTEAKSDENLLQNKSIAEQSILIRNNSKSECIVNNNIDENNENNLNNIFSFKNPIITKSSLNRKTQEQLPEENKIILNTINREIGEFNNDLYIINSNESKIENEDFKFDNLNSKISFVQNVNDKSCSTTNLKNIHDLKSVNKTKLNNIQIASCEKIEEAKGNNNFTKLKVKMKNENNNIKRGFSSQLGNSKNLSVIEIKEIWNKRKIEIFKNIEDKKNGKDSKRLFIQSTRIKPNLSLKKEVTKDKKELYYSNKNPNFNKMKYETPDIKVNISVFVKENFEKDKSIFKIKRKNELMETSEISKSIFINSNKISNILNSKYDYLRKNCVEKNVEKSINLRKNDK